MSTNETTNRLNDSEFWGKVKFAYTQDTITRDPALTREIACIKDAITKYFDPSNGVRYIIEEFLGVGGVGIVFKAWDSVLHTNRAIKIARPIEGKEDLIQSLVSEEISNLQEVNHPNIISIFDVGKVQSTSGELPFYAMTFLKGALNGRNYFSTKRSADQLLKFLDGFFEGIAHLHSIKLIHLDLKPSNVFVREDGFPVIGDLGGTRKIAGNPEDDILITCTSTYAHPELLALTSVSSGGEDNRRRGTIKRRELKLEYDQHASGKSLFEIIKKFESINPTTLSSYQKKYLQLQSARLLCKTETDERPLGLTEYTLSRINYKVFDDARTDFDKLIGRTNLINEIPELTPAADSIIQISRGRRTRLTPRLTRLLSNPLMRRLASISQLGLVRLVYPGATHTRFEHSLGTYSNAANYIRSLYYDPINPLFRQIMSKEDLLTTLLAALLHDLGQYQHAHDLYDVEPKIFKHEVLTTSLLKGTWFDHNYLTEPLKKLLLQDWNITPERIVSILEVNPNNLSADIKDRILHTIISGPLDADKLDYLLRDSDNCQTIFGNGLDRSRLLSVLTIVYQRQGRQDEQYFSLGIHEKGRAAAESVGFIRFQMFNAVYWHHTVRAAKVMLQNAAYEWIAPDGQQDKSKHDKLKRELYDFILSYTKQSKLELKGHPQLFGDQPSYESVRIGFSSNPQWSGLCYSDFLFLQWLYERTSDFGKQLIESIARRDLYKRIFVISALQSRSLWDKIQNGFKEYADVTRFSEMLRKSLKSRVDELISQSTIDAQIFYVTGVGEDSNNVISASRVLGKKGAILIDSPKCRGTENLLFFPEDMHRSQKEEFEAPSLLVVSELWNLVSNKLHETAGNIRIFVHPDIAILKSAKTKDGKRILDSQIIEEELSKIFEV